MKSKSLNIVIYPPREIFQKAITVSEQFNKKEKGLFALNDKNYFPHITIYMAEFPVHNIPKIKKVLRDFIITTKSFHMISLKYYHSDDGYIFVDYKKSPELKNLQKKIVNLLNPLREDLLRAKDVDRMNDLDKNSLEFKNIKRYGYRSVGENFSPHLTFTKLAISNNSLLAKIAEFDFSFKFDQLGLFYLGEYGTCHDLIEIFKIKK